MNGQLAVGPVCKWITCTYWHYMKGLGSDTDTFVIDKVNAMSAALVAV